MIKVFSDNKEIPVNMVEFSDGAITFKVEGLPLSPKYISITVDPSTKGYRVLEEFNLITSALLLGIKGVDFTNTKFILNMPYLYNARADRYFEDGNPHPLMEFLIFLRDHIGMGDWEIHCCDIHNLNAVNSFKGLNIIEKTQLSCFKDTIAGQDITSWDVVCCPDKGAVEKATTIAEYLGVPCVYANKKRDVSTGKLLTMELPDYDFTGKKVLIPDDIGDKMGTHIWLADLLKEAGASQVDLYITHLIAPTGLKHLTGKIDKIYCYQTVAGYINKQTVNDYNLGKI